MPFPKFQRERGSLTKAEIDAINEAKLKLISPVVFSWDGKNKERACEHIIEQLRRGVIPLGVILGSMVPRISSKVFSYWRTQDEELAQAVEDAFAYGIDNNSIHQRLVAAGVPGYSSRNHKRDRLILLTDQRLQAAWDRRYRTRQIHENPDGTALTPAQFVIQPVRPADYPEDAPTPTPDDEDVLDSDND